MSVDLSSLGLDDLEQQNGLPPGWLAAQAQIESAGNPNAVSPAGAQGLFQFLPATAAQYGIDPFDPQQAAQAAAQMNGELFRKYDGDPAKVAAAYNWGQGNVDRKGLENAPLETQHYGQKFAAALPDVFKNVAGAFSVGSANAAEAQPDLSSLSDEELNALEAQHTQSQPDLSQLTDEQLNALEKQHTAASGDSSGITKISFGGTAPDGTAAPTNDSDQRPLLGRDLNPLEGFAAPFVNALGDNGLPVGKYIAGAARGLSAASGLQSLIDGPGAPTTYGEGYQQGKDYFGGVERQFENQYPDGALASSGAGQLFGLGTGSALAKLGATTATRVAPKAASALANWAVAHPRLAEAGLGAAVGGTQGYLSDNSNHPGAAAAMGAGFGSVAGPLVAYGARVLAKPFAKEAARLAPAGGTQVDIPAPRERIEPTLYNQAPLSPPAQTNSRIGKVTLKNPAPAAVVQEVPAKLQADGGILTSEAVKTNASKLYKQAENDGGLIGPQAVNSLADDVQKIGPQTSAGKRFFGGNDVTDVLKSFDAQRGKPLSLAEVQEIDEGLGDMIDSHYTNGKLSKVGAKLVKIQDKLRAFADNAGVADIVGGTKGFTSLKAARQEYAKAMSLQDIERIINRASQMQVPATGLKSGFRTLANSSTRMRAFKNNPDMVKAINRAAKTGLLTGGLNLLGSRLADTIVGVTAGGLHGLAAAHSVGYVARQGAEKLQMNRANDVLRLISNNGKRSLKTPANRTGAVTGGTISGKIAATKRKQ